MKRKLKRYKKEQNQKKQIRNFEKRINLDINLLNLLRNSFYGHSLLHLDQDRKKLTNSLRDWYIRSGHNQKFAKLSFQKNRIEKDVVRESPALYKMGLRTSRLFLFMLLGITTSIPFASHDFKTIGDMKDSETSEYKGINMKFTIKQRE